MFILNGLSRAWRRHLLILLVAGTACDPFHTTFEGELAAEGYQASQLKAAAKSPASLKVMSYNVKFGGGRVDFFFDCHGDRVLMSETEVMAHLEALAAKIREHDPDVLLLQEVDTGAKRSAFVNQLQWLLDTTDLNYGLYASQWRADFVPSHGIGAMDSGNAILSKYPLQEGVRIGLPLIEEQSAVEQYFYLRRNLLVGRVVISEKHSLAVLNTHAEAFSNDGTKKKHIDAFKQRLDELAEYGKVVAGGDLNALPPGTDRLRNFPDSACSEEFEADDFRAETAWLAPLYRDYASAIPLEAYQANNALYFSHTTARDGFWNRKLDYLFTNLVLRDGSVDQGRPTTDSSDSQPVGDGYLPTMPISDHAPVLGILDIE